MIAWRAAPIEAEAAPRMVEIIRKRTKGARSASPS